MPQLQLRRRAALIFIFVTAIMDILSLGVMFPVLPSLIKQLNGGDTAAAAQWSVLFAVSWGVMQFLFSPILGQLSDRFGRRPVILMSTFGLGIDYLFMAFAPTLGWLLVGRFLNGITSASISTVNAYVADVTTPENRARGFSMIAAAFGVGFTIGPALGGWLAGFGLRVPFMVCAGLTLCSWLYGFFVLPESLPPERRIARFRLSRANPVGALRMLGSYPSLYMLVAVQLLFQLAQTVMPSVMVLYAGFRYGWSPARIGLNMMLTGIAGIFVQTVIVGPVIRRLGERGGVILGFSLGIVGYLTFGLAPVGWMFMAAIPFSAMLGLVQPGLQALMTKLVGPQEQGQLQGVNSSLIGIAAVAGPVLFGLSFAWALRHDDMLHLPGLPLVIAAFLMMAALAIVARSARSGRGQHQLEAESGTSVRA